MEIVIASDDSMTTVSATSSVCSRVKNVRCAKRLGLEISSSEKEPSSRRIGDSPAMPRGGVRLLQLRRMGIRKTLKKAARWIRGELRSSRTRVLLLHQLAVDWNE